MDLSGYVSALRRRWLVIALLVLGGAGIAFGVAKATTPTYEATSKVFVSLSTGQTASDLVQGSTYIKNVVDSYAALASLPVVLDPVIKELGLPVGAAGLAPSIRADSPLNTSIIEISATSDSAQAAADLANAVARQLSLAVAQLSPSGGSNGQAVKVSGVSPAIPPKGPAAPRTQLLVATGAGAGLALGVALALLLSLLDTRVRDPDDVEFLHDEAAVLATVPIQSRRKNTALPMIVDPLSPRAESYRRLQTNLSFINASTPIKVIVVSSATPGEGKTSTAVNLAISIAETSRKVLLIDGDLRRPTVAAALWLEGSVGLTTVLIGRADLSEVTQSAFSQGLNVLTSGEVPPNPHQLLDSRAMSELILRAREEYDMVIIDSPPVLPVSDAALTSRLADGVLMVVGCKRVRRKDVVQGLRDLQAGGADCLGLVMTFSADSSPRHDYYGLGPVQGNSAASWLRSLFGRGKDAAGRDDGPGAHQGTLRHAAQPLAGSPAQRSGARHRTERESPQGASLDATFTTKSPNGDATRARTDVGSGE